MKFVIYVAVWMSTMLCPRGLHAQTTAHPESTEAKQPVFSKPIQWSVTPPILSVESAKLPASEEFPWVAVKDPSIVRSDDRWHLFCTLRRKKEGQGRIAIGYASFKDWDKLTDAPWSVIRLTDDYHGAPQIFYFRPQKLWYLIYQATDPKRKLSYGPCYSTNKDIGNPAGWTLPEPMYIVADGEKAGLDFWVICDHQRAYLFYTSLDGRMWRRDTLLKDFPADGWSKPVVALKADIFEASHTYKVAGRQQYLTFIEAQHGRRRYFKAYQSETLDGQWQPIADTRKNPFVSPVNVVNQSESWATSYSHGEFLRVGSDELLEVDIQELKMLFQGADDGEYQSNGYGNIPWQLGIINLRN